jgi:hypothetical protein
MQTPKQLKNWRLANYLKCHYKSPLFQSISRTWKKTHEYYFRYESWLHINNIYIMTYFWLWLQCKSDTAERIDNWPQHTHTQLTRALRHRAVKLGNPKIKYNCVRYIEPGSCTIFYINNQISFNTFKHSFSSHPQKFYLKLWIFWILLITYTKQQRSIMHIS